MPATDTLPLVIRWDTIVNGAGTAILFARVTLTHVGDGSFAGSAGACAWEFSAYSDADRTGDPVWADDIEGRLDDPRFACALSLVEFDLSGGESKDFPRGAVNLPASLEGGTYYLSVRLRGWLAGASVMNDPPTWLTEQLPAGAIELIR